MPKDQIEEKLRWIKPIIDGRLNVDQVIQVCPFSRRTLFNWLKKYELGGKLELVNQSTRPKTSPNTTNETLVERIIDLHCENQVGALKIKWLLESEGIHLGLSTIQRILGKHGLVKPKRKTNQHKYKLKKVTQPGELVEIDIKYGINFGFGRWWYQYTALDVASRWRFLLGFHNMENNLTINFMDRLCQQTLSLFQIKAIKTDNGSVFTNRLNGLKQDFTYRPHALDEWCNFHDITHYLISPGCPTQNGCIERSHRTDQECFYNHLTARPPSLDDYNYQLRLWNNCYNELPHCGLKGLSPNQYLAQYC